MDKASSCLAEWIINYIKNKDLISKNVEDIEENINKNYILVNYKEKKHVFLIRPFIDNIEEVINDINDACSGIDKPQKSLIILNNKENFKIVISGWSKLVSLGATFSLYFVNPFSQTDKRWIIYPYTHNMISERSSLKQGLKALFESVDPITESGLKLMLKE